MKTRYFIFIIFLFLIILRLLLPYAILHYAEYRINKIPEYHASIKDVDVGILSGSYRIKNITLNKVSQHIPVPFFSAKSILLKIQWKALLHGLFVAEIQFDEPQVNFVIDPKGKAEQLTIDQEWQNAVKALFPLNFNEIIIHHGSLHFQSFTSSPPFDLFLKNIEATVTNLEDRSRSQKEGLSSSLLANANTMDGAPVKLEIYFDPFAKQPTFKLNASLEKMSIKDTNNFLQHYTKIKVQQGRFSLFVEAAAANGKVKGYAKPIFKNLSIVEPKSDNPVEALYKGAVKVVTKILENPSTKTVATKIEVAGDVEDPNVSLLSAIANILRHAFLQALLPQIDHTVDIGDVISPT
ncbi:MAG: hypothetical protein K0S08_435 [Gammaproteobacteria bacterium]|jgi:uncharacterized protein YhdP|nr:hypothetical protein [Gammaproteobacteria bacterium]